MLFSEPNPCCKNKATEHKGDVAHTHWSSSITAIFPSELFRSLNVPNSLEPITCNSSASCWSWVNVGWDEIFVVDPALYTQFPMTQVKGVSVLASSRQVLYRTWACASNASIADSHFFATVNFEASVELGYDRIEDGSPFLRSLLLFRRIYTVLALSDIASGPLQKRIQRGSSRLETVRDVSWLSSPGSN